MPLRRQTSSADELLGRVRTVAPSDEVEVRRADVGDVADIGHLLHDFNTEYDDPTPGPAALASRLEELLEGGDTVVLLAGEGPDGLAVLRFRLAIWSSGLECYLAELYVKPDRRGRGLGRALMQAVLISARERGADSIDLGTDETDVAARHLYQSFGFSHRTGGDNGPVMYVYERDL
jgi:ribosomal protein S18 acetylase RimI-like enzyme